MTTTQRYPVEIWERAVRMAFDSLDEYDARWAANSSIAFGSEMIPETLLHEWVRRAGTDERRRPGLTTDVVLGVARAS